MNLLNMAGGDGVHCAIHSGDGPCTPQMKKDLLHDGCSPKGRLLLPEIAFQFRKLFFIYRALPGESGNILQFAVNHQENHRDNKYFGEGKIDVMIPPRDSWVKSIDVKRHPKETNDKR